MVPVTLTPNSFHLYVFIKRQKSEADVPGAVEGQRVMSAEVLAYDSFSLVVWGEYCNKLGISSE